MENNEDIKQTPASEVPTGEEKPETTEEQDPLKQELKRVETRKGRSELEQALYKRNQLDMKIKELGGEIKEPVEDDEDEKPLTRGEFKRMQQETAQKTALELAEKITNESERELAKFHLQNTIRSTGNAQEDLDLALGLVNAAKNRQILEETNRKPESSSRTSGVGAPANAGSQANVEYTLDEAMMMRPPFNLTREQVLEARKKAAEQK